MVSIRFVGEFFLKKKHVWVFHKKRKRKRRGSKCPVNTCGRYTNLDLPHVCRLPVIDLLFERTVCFTVPCFRLNNMILSILDTSRKAQRIKILFFFYRPRSPCFLRSIGHLSLDGLWWWTWSELWLIFIRTVPFVSNDLVVSSIPLLEKVDCWLMHCVLWCLWDPIEMVCMHQPH